MEKIILDTSKFQDIQVSLGHLISTKLGDFWIYVPELEPNIRVLRTGIESLLEDVLLLEKKVNAETADPITRFFSEEIYGLLDMGRQFMSALFERCRDWNQRAVSEVSSLDEVLSEITALRKLVAEQTRGMGETSLGRNLERVEGILKEFQKKDIEW